jgi:secreted trypsin-like serine protease
MMIEQRTPSALRRTAFALALAPSLLFACDAPEDAGTFRIINGAPALSSDAPEYAATVGLHFKVTGKHFSSQPNCSGTLIAPDVVASAAHCLVEQKGFSISAVAPGDVMVFFGDVAGQGQLVPVAQTWVHPAYDPYALHNDIALLRLQNPASIAPIPALPAALALDASDVSGGTLLDFVGFGYSNTAKTQYGEKLHNDLPLGALGCPQNVYPECPTGAPADTQFSYSQVDEDAAQVEGPCNGDSGGPAFVVRGGQTYLAGITSYGDAVCTDYGVSTTVSAFEAEIAAFIEGSGGDSGGDDSGGTLSCGDGVCDADESCDGRNGTVSCKSDCPGKTNGKPSGRFCWIGDTCEGPGC